MISTHTLYKQAAVAELKTRVTEDGFEITLNTVGKTVSINAKPETLHMFFNDFKLWQDPPGNRLGTSGGKWLLKKGWAYSPQHGFKNPATGQYLDMVAAMDCQMMKEAEANGH